MFLASAPIEIVGIPAGYLTFGTALCTFLTALLGFWRSHQNSKQITEVHDAVTENTKQCKVIK